MKLLSNPIFVFLPALCLAIACWFCYCMAAIELGPDGRIPTSLAKSYVSNSHMMNLFGIIGGAGLLIHLWCRRKSAAGGQSNSSVTAG
jgi:hypothetical protein